MQEYKSQLIDVSPYDSPMSILSALSALTPAARQTSRMNSISVSGSACSAAAADHGTLGTSTPLYRGHSHSRSRSYGHNQVHPDNIHRRDLGSLNKKNGSGSVGGGGQEFRGACSGSSSRASTDGDNFEHENAHPVNAGTSAVGVRPSRTSFASVSPSAGRVSGLGSTGATNARGRYNGHHGKSSPGVGKIAYAHTNATTPLPGPGNNFHTQALPPSSTRSVTSSVCSDYENTWWDVASVGGNSAPSSVQSHKSTGSNQNSRSGYSHRRSPLATIHFDANVANTFSKDDNNCSGGDTSIDSKKSKLYSNLKGLQSLQSEDNEWATQEPTGTSSAGTDNGNDETCNGNDNVGDCNNDEENDEEDEEEDGIENEIWNALLRSKKKCKNSVSSEEEGNAGGVSVSKLYDDLLHAVDDDGDIRKEEAEADAGAHTESESEVNEQERVNGEKVEEEEGEKVEGEEKAGDAQKIRKVYNGFFSPTAAPARAVTTMPNLRKTVSWFKASPLPPMHVPTFTQTPGPAPEKLHLGTNNSASSMLQTPVINGGSGAEMGSVGDTIDCITHTPITTPQKIDKEMR